MATAQAQKGAQDSFDLDDDLTATAATPPPPQRTPPPSPPKNYGEKPPPPKKPLARPEQWIFRKLKKPHPAIDKINIDFHWISHAYLATSSIILWPYRVTNAGRIPLPLNDDLEDLNGPDIQWLPRTVRYIYSANSPFADEQEVQFGDALKKNDNGFNEILDNPQNRDGLVINGAELKVEAYDSVRINYLRLNGQCQNMHPKARRRNQRPVYQLLDFGQIDKEKIDLGRKKRAMYEIAGSAHLEEMIPHAKHLGIQFTVFETGQERDLDAVREDYKQAALDNPVFFEQTFRDPKIKIMHQIITLKDTGNIIISAGRAKWAHTNAVITLIPATANPIEFLANFSLENRDFAEQLAASKINL